MLDTRPTTASMGGYLPPPSRAESSFKHYPEDMDNGPEVINVTANATTTLLPGKDYQFSQVLRTTMIPLQIATRWRMIRSEKI